MFKEINLRNHSSLHKLFYSLISNDKYCVIILSSLNEKHLSLIIDVSHVYFNTLLFIINGDDFFKKK